MAITDNKRVQQLLGGHLSAERRAHLISRMWDDEADIFPQLVALMSVQMEDLKEKVGELCKPPLSVGIVLQEVATTNGPAVQISDPKGNLSVVGSQVQVTPGDMVLLNAQGVIVEKAELAHAGESVGTFDHAGDGVPVLVDNSGHRVTVSVGSCNPKPGDVVAYRAASIRRVLGKPRTSRFTFESELEGGFANVGGLSTQINEITQDLDLHLAHPEVRQKFGLRPLRGVILTGPPGNGKTMLAKGMASHLKATYPDVRFLNVKPGSLRGSLYGQTESNIRELFAEAKSCQFAVIFFDELDNFGSRATQSVGTEIDSRVMATLLSEIDGLETNGTHVLCVGATNRLDLCDPALIREGRLGDRIYTIPRPNREGTLAIVQIYLHDRLPYYNCTREECVGAAIDTLFPLQPPVLAHVSTRDGEVHGLEPCDLVSGSLIATGIEKAKHIAAARSLGRSRRVGITQEDIHEGLLHSINTEAAKIIGRPEIARATLSAPWADRVSKVTEPEAETDNNKEGSVHE